jgi:hypothetical protein
MLCVIWADNAFGGLMEKKAQAKKATAKKATRKAKVETAGTEAKVTRQAKPKSRMGGKSCQVGGCKRSYKAKGYCKAHYRQWRHGKFAKARYKHCHDYGCTKPMAANRHGFCEQHFQDFYVKGMEQHHAPVAAPKAAPAAKAEETAA